MDALSRKIRRWLPQNRRRKRAEDSRCLMRRLRMSFISGAARIGKNAAVPKGARAPFRGVPETSPRSFPRRCGARWFAASAAIRRVSGRAASPPPPNSVARTASNFIAPRIPVPNKHDPCTNSRGPAQNLVVHRKCGAHRKARIARRRLHVNPLKRRVIENFSVRDAVERNSTREAKRLLARFFREAHSKRDQHFFKRRLHARREVVVALAERLFRFARADRAASRGTAKKACPSTGVLIRFAPGHVRALV